MPRSLRFAPLVGALLCCSLLVPRAVAPARAGVGDRLDVTVFGGLVASGRLFRADSRVSRSWITPDGRPLEGIELRAEVDEGPAGGLRVGYRVLPRLSLVTTATLARLEVTAQHRSEATNQVQLAKYDDLTVFLGEAGVRWELAPSPSHLFVVGGVGLASLSFDDSESLDQTRPFVSAAIGYHWRLDESLQLEFEIRDAVFTKDLDDEQARLRPDGFDDEDPQHLFQFVAGWVLRF